MDSSNANPDGTSSVFYSPDSSFEPQATEKFETSVSVSSLAEKFERNGDFGSLPENIDSKMSESKDSPSQLIAESNDNFSSPLPGENKRIASIFKTSNKVCVTDQTARVGNVAPLELFSSKVDTAAQEVKDVACVYCVGLQSSNFSTDVATAAREVKNKNATCIYCVQSDVAATNVATVQEIKNTNVSCVGAQASNSGAGVKKNVPSGPQGSPELATSDQISKAVEERVAYFVEKISQNSAAGAPSKDMQNSASDSAVGKQSSSEHDERFRGIVKSISLKDLEQSFVTALNMANCYEKRTEKSAGTLPVPSIQITEASDREDSVSDDTEETKPKCEVGQTKVKTPIENKMEESDAEPSNRGEPVPSTSAVTQYQNYESEISLEERLAQFYISSSEIPEPPENSSTNELQQNSDEYQRSAIVEPTEYSGTNPVVLDDSENETSSCLCSKSLYGAIFLACFILSLGGFILYNFALEGKVPDFCEHVGFVTAILAGLLGAFSCCCYNLLGAFPSLPARYRRMRETRNMKSQTETKKIQEILDEESWTSEKEKAFRRQNGMSSISTSTESMKSDQCQFLLVRKSDHKELVDKAERMKKEVVGLLDSFSDVMTKIKEIEAIRMMESGELAGV